MVQVLSSKITFAQKFVFPTIWTLGFGAGTLAMFTGGMHGKNGAPVPPETKWIFLTMWTAGTTFIFYWSGSLKKVSLENDSLIISNYFREARVHMSQVADVREQKWVKGNPIIITFRSDTAFGRKIVFLPQMRLRLFGPHPILEELKKLHARFH